MGALGNTSASAGTILIAVLICLGLPVRGEPVRSLFEDRVENVVRQEFDLSCGAAALTTVLNFQHGERLSERAVALGMIAREEYIADPQMLRHRRGFSMLDMKRYAERLGYRATGHGGLSLDNLSALAPAIVPVNLLGYEHFVVFRGALDGQVFLADPAYGNRSMPVSRFLAAWQERPDLGRLGLVIARNDGLSPPNRLAPTHDEIVMTR